MSNHAEGDTAPAADRHPAADRQPGSRHLWGRRIRSAGPHELLRRLRGEERGAERGQLLVLFTLVLVAIIASAGLLIDGGMAYTNRRQAQNAADTAALAAAQNLAAGGTPTAMTAAGTSIAASNLFNTNYTDCSGRSQNNGVVVNSPPLAGAFVNQSGYVEVVVSRPMKTSFASLVGQSCWMVSARAVAVANNTSVASCNFCSLNSSNQNHTLVLKNSAQLRVDGEIYVNSSNGGVTPGVCKTNNYNVCGDAFDVFGTGGSISAKTISVVGGWETHDQNIATADQLATGCVDHPNPPSQSQTANVCIHMPVLVDPLNDTSKGGNVINPPAFGAKPVAGTNGCPVGATVPNGTSQLTISNGDATLCPGTYYGGIAISGGTVTMQAGIYVMQGGGFQVTGKAKLDGTAGVMIYSSSGSGASSSTTTANDLVPPPTPGLQTLQSAVLSTSRDNVNPGDPVTFTMTLTPNGNRLATPTGTVDFYDGDVQICSASPLVLVHKNVVAATCATSFANWGTRAISAVYSGDSVYNAAGNTYTETVKQPAGVPAGAITITSTGKIDLSGPKSGPYSGLTLFQDRTSNLTITLAPGASSRKNCPANFMTAGVPPDNSAVPAACGALGGLQGTVYAANQDALVLITAGGMANLQVIAGQIEVDSGANARFGYAASLFANGSIHLVE